MNANPNNNSAPNMNVAPAETLGEEMYIRPALEKLRAFLLPFALFYTYGFYTPIDGILRSIVGFSVPAFFMVSGYLVLREDGDITERILRAIKRSGLCFVILAAVYGLLSLIFFKDEVLPFLFAKRFWFNIIVLNYWGLPIGSVIWYVQALLYAYIIIYVLHKLNLLKFDIVFAVLFLVVTVLTGELSTVINFNFLGYTYISGNFFTRALPYILIGCFVHRKKDFLYMKLSAVKCIIIAAFGVAASVIEYCALFYSGNLNYPGHLIGMGITALGVCCYGFFFGGNDPAEGVLHILSRTEMMIPYYVSSPAYALVSMFFVWTRDTQFILLSDLIGVFTVALSYLSIPIYLAVSDRIIDRKWRKEMENNPELFENPDGMPYPENNPENGREQK